MDLRRRIASLTLGALALSLATPPAWAASHTAIERLSA